MSSGGKNVSIISATRDQFFGIARIEFNGSNRRPAAVALNRRTGGVITPRAEKKDAVRKRPRATAMTTAHPFGPSGRDLSLPKAAEAFSPALSTYCSQERSNQRIPSRVDRSVLSSR